MSDIKGVRLSKLAKELNVGINTITDFLKKKGHTVEHDPNAKISPELVTILEKEFSSEISAKKESEKVDLKGMREKKETIVLHEKHQSIDKDNAEEAETSLNESKEKIELKVVGKINLETPKVEKPAPKVVVEEPKKEVVVEEKPKIIEKPAAKVEKPVDFPLEVSNEIEAPKVVGRINLDNMNLKTRPDKKTKEERIKEDKERQKGAKANAAARMAESQAKNEEVKAPVIEEIEEAIESTSREDLIRMPIEKLNGPKVLGKIDLPSEKEKKLVVSSSNIDSDKFKKKKRKRIKIEGQKVSVVPEQKAPAKPLEVKLKKDKKKFKKPFRPEVSEEEVSKQIKETLARLTTKGKSKTSKYRREKREEIRERQQAELDQQEIDKNILKVTEFVSVNELATMMDVPATKLIATCMSLGLFVSINQRLDAETIVLLAEEHNFKVEFISAEIQEAIKEEEIDTPEQLLPRSPIVTVMGHVDHGKTKLLDFIRNTNVIAGEAGGITQHIGAYSVQVAEGKQITFLDTPGHEAFTAMRARGAKITDIAIIVVAADDGVMPQTREAINHAQAAGVPIIFAINKIDKPTANPEKIKEELAAMNLLVEDWGGKYQSQEVSAKSGLNIDKLLEKILLEAEMLDLKANPDKNAKGTVVESTLDKGRGYVATILVQNGTLKQGDLVLAGTNYGKVKAMYNERGKKIDIAGPSTPVLILGLNGAPQAGDEFHVLNDEKEVKDIATKREQLQREQGLRTKKHITLDEIGRRIAIGNFKELNVIVKGDVDGSIEALSDSLIKLSTEEIQVNIIHKAVGQISESDIMLAVASNAIVIGFQVRPSLSARRIAEKEQIEIRLYSIIYDAIEEIKDAMEGMLSPEIKEEIVATLEVREVFKISKVGAIAGCMCKEGKIQRSTKVRVIRDGIVVYTGELASLKRFKDDVKEVLPGQDCGLGINNFNDMKVGDIVEGYKETEVKKKL